MNIKLQPVGQKILVLPIQQKNYVTETNIEIVEKDLAKGEVVEVSEEYADLYKKGDIVVYSRHAGVSQQYNGKSCICLNAKGAPEGDIWFIVTEEN